MIKIIKNIFCFLRDCWVSYRTFQEVSKKTKVKLKSKKKKSISRYEKSPFTKVWEMSQSDD